MTPSSLSDLLNSLLTFLIAFPTLALLQVFLHYYWVFKMNTPYYRELLQLSEKKKRSKYDLTEEQEAILLEKEAMSAMEKKQRERALRKAGKLKKKKKKKKDRKAPFVAFPGIFVFPSLLTLCCTFFITGLVGSSVELLAECAVEYAPSAQGVCQTPAVLVLMAITLLLVGMLSQLVHFWIRYRQQWEPEAPIDDCEAIEDPLYRWVSKVRVKIFREGTPHLRMDRARGEFMKQWENTREPERTERLLRQPIIFYRPNASDAIDSLKIVLMNRTSGTSFWGLMYDFNMFFAQVIIAILTGVGGALVPGTPAAATQVISIFVVQFTTGFAVFLTGPSVDRFDNLISGLQFTIEGSQTLLLYLGTLDVFAAAQGQFAIAAFLLSLFAMMLPIIEKGYDAIIVQLSIICRKEDFSWLACGFTMLAFLLTLPQLIAGLVGLDLGEGDFEGAMDEAVGVAEFLNDDLAEGFASVAAVGAGAASNVAYTMRPAPHHHRSALRIQRHMRARQLKRQALEHSAAARLQAHIRGSQTRKVLAIEIGAAKDWTKSREGKKGGGASGEASAMPGQLGWLEQEEMRNLRQERLQRARQDFNRKSTIVREPSRLPVRMPDERSVGAPKSNATQEEASEISTLNNVRRRTVAVQLNSEGSSGGSKLSARAHSFTRAKRMKEVSSYYDLGKQRSTASRDHLHDVAGILYTRANPRITDGHQGTDQLRVAVLRMKRARAHRALPANLPPQTSLFHAATIADAAYREAHHGEEDSSSSSEDDSERKEGATGRVSRLAGHRHDELPAIESFTPSRWKRGERSISAYGIPKAASAGADEDTKAASDDEAERAAVSRRVASARSLLPGMVPPAVITPGVDATGLAVAYSVNIPPSLRAGGALSSQGPMNRGSTSVSFASAAPSGERTSQARSGGIVRSAPVMPPFDLPGGPRRAASRKARNTTEMDV